MGEKVEEEDDEEGGDELAKGELRYNTVYTRNLLPYSQL
jgi:hypothetical protein